MSDKSNFEKESQRSFSVVVMAAGKGTRMKSPLPKVLHPVAGRPMIERVLKACKEAGAREIRVVVGHGEKLVRQIIEPTGVLCYSQKEQVGTADAVKSAQIDQLEGDVIVLNGDHPLIEAGDLKNLLQCFRDEKLDVAVVTALLKYPKEMGRIVRHKGELVAIVEAKDASADTLKIREINTGIYLIKANVLQRLLPEIRNENAKGEYYFTDIISLAIQGKFKVQALKGKKKIAMGVNSQEELSIATAALFRRKSKDLMANGVVIIDPRSTYVEDSVEIGPGSVLYPNCFLRGKSRLGSFCVIESNCFVSDCVIGESVQIKSGSYLERSELKSRVQVGPYARIRPDTLIEEEAHIGNFVELKKVHFGKKSKAGHLSYLGDAIIGEDVNVGCGTITCNYATDRKKYQTKIGNRVFVGSDTQFIAPVEIGDDAVIGSGSTITKNVPAKSLAVARGRQVVKENYSPSDKSVQSKAEITANISQQKSSSEE